MDRGRFSEAALCADASERAGGLTDFGPELDDFRANLAALVASALDEARLRDADALRELLLHHLVNRLRIGQCLARAPEIAGAPVPRPLFVSGLPRAGTTTFSRLLGEDARVRALRLWELLSPAPTDLEHPGALTEDRIAAAERAVLARARRGTLEIRPISIFSPDECFYLMRNSFDSDHLHRAVARMPAYFRYLAGRDRRGVYAYYKLQLQLLLWQRPCPPDGLVVLKNPFVHSENLGAIFALFPGAAVVDLTRDAAAVLRSLCHKNHLDRQAWSDHVRAEDVGSDMVENLEIYYRRRAAALEGLTPAQRARVASIHLDAWAGDPIAIARRVYAWLGQPLPDARADAMAAALARHPPYGEAARYDLAAYGLREGELRERFAPYEAAFRARVRVIE